jgi:monofunctional biosynthetic peptidoglycan transglycosylase
VAGAWWLSGPDVAALSEQNPRATAFIERYRAERRAAGEPAGVAWQPVPYERISVHLKRAVVAAEDMEFFAHRGFSSSELKQALRTAVRRLDMPRGASTITQQLAKNLWLSPTRDPFRKLKEALLTRRLERHLSKRRILELYLNVVEFGRGVYGAEAAAQTYFGKSAEWLTEEEAAQLAASLPRPSRWHPGVASEGYLRYAMEIRRRMDVATFLWRAVGGATPPESVRVAMPDLDSLLGAVRESVAAPESIPTDTVPPRSDSLRASLDRRALRDDTIR